MTDPTVKKLMAEWRARLRGDSGRGSPESAHHSAVPRRLDLERQVLSTQPAKLEDLLGEVEEFGEDQLRRAENAELEVVLTDEGLHIWDPSAQHVLVIDCVDGALPVVLARTDRDHPPIRLTLPLHDRGPRTLVVVTTRTPIDPDLCVLWVSDARVAGLKGWKPESTPKARVATVRIETKPRPLALNVAPEKLPPTSTKVQKQLSEAAALGRSGAYPEAATAYTRARQTARTHGDTSGQLKAALGLSLSLGWLGYQDDANRLLAAVATESVLDREWGARLSLHLAWSRLRCGDVAGAERWLEENLRLDGPRPWPQILQARLAQEHGHWRRALDILKSIKDDEHSALPTATQTLLRLAEARCLIELGQFSAARVVRGSEVPAEHQLAVRDLQLRVRLSTKSGRRVNWFNVAEEASSLPASAIRDPEVRAPLVGLAAWALEQKGLSSAHALLQHALGANKEAALVVSTRSGSLVRGFDGHLRSSSLTWSDMRELARDARGEVHGNRVARASRTLQTLLAAEQAPEGQVTVLDDGCLRGAPLQALIELAVDRPVPMRAVELASTRAREVGSPQGDAILSLADVCGDLPHARTELPPDRRTQAFYGSDATWAALQLAGDLGLLHIAVHTRTVGAVVSLELADRLVGPNDLLQLRLEGSPLCILSGCTTTGLEADRTSFASALLEAGASGVVTTAWPVDDAEMARFVRGIARGWRNQPIVELVANMRHRLRREGAPARLWAAPQLF